MPNEIRRFESLYNDKSVRSVELRCGHQEIRWSDKTEKSSLLNLRNRTMVLIDGEGCEPIFIVLDLEDLKDVQHMISAAIAEHEKKE